MVKQRCAEQMSSRALKAPVVVGAISLACAVIAISIPGAWGVDADNDEMDDAYEVFFGLDPTTNDAALDPDSDSLPNSAEYVLWTDPFSADTDRDGFPDNTDTTPVSRAYMDWGEPFFTAGNDYGYAAPAWWVAAYKVAGSWQTNAPTSWRVLSSASNGVCSLHIEVDRSVLTSDSVLKLAFYGQTNASLYVDLYASDETVVAENIFGDLVTGTNDTTLVYLNIPFETYTNAVGIRIRWGSGEIAAFESLVFLDQDGDGLDSDQEDQLGTDDTDTDSDDDGVDDLTEYQTGTDPTDSLSVDPTLRTDVPGAWQPMTPQELAAEYVRLTEAGPAGAGERELLAGYAGQRYTAASAAGNLDIREWLDMAIAARRALPAAMRTAMIGEILNQLTPNDAALLALEGADIARIGDALRKIGHPRPAVGAMVKKWIEESEKCNSARAEDLTVLSTMAKYTGEAGTAIRDKLVGLIDPKSAGSPEAVRSLPLRQWRAALSCLFHELPPETRARWAGAIYAAYMSDASTVAGLSFAQCRDLEYVLQKLGHEQWEAPFASWITDTGKWQSLSPIGLAKVAERLPLDVDGAKARWDFLVARVETDFLADAETIRGVSIDGWGGLFKNILARVPPETDGGWPTEDLRNTWSRKLHEAYTDGPEVLAELSLFDCQLLWKSLQFIAPGQPLPVGSRWVKNCDAWKSLPAKQLLGLAMLLNREQVQSSAEVEAVRTEIEEEVLADSETVFALGCGVWGNAARYLAQRLPTESRRLWIGGLRSAFVEDRQRFAALKANEVAALGKALEQLGDAESSKVVAAWMLKK